MKTVPRLVLFRNFLEEGTLGRKVLAVSKENCHSERLVLGARNLLLRRREKADSSLRSE
jgi:hypothetical protein